MSSSAESLAELTKAVAAMDSPGQDSLAFAMDALAQACIKDTENSVVLLAHIGETLRIIALNADEADVFAQCMLATRMLADRLTPTEGVLH